MPGRIRESPDEADMPALPGLGEERPWMTLTEDVAAGVWEPAGNGRPRRSPRRERRCFSGPACGRGVCRLTLFLPKTLRRWRARRHGP